MCVYVCLSVCVCMSPARDSHEKNTQTFGTLGRLVGISKPSEGANNDNRMRGREKQQWKQHCRTESGIDWIVNMLSFSLLAVNNSRGRAVSQFDLSLHFTNRQSLNVVHPFGALKLIGCVIQFTWWWQWIWQMMANESAFANRNQVLESDAQIRKLYRIFSGRQKTNKAKERNRILKIIQILDETVKVEDEISEEWMERNKNILDKCQRSVWKILFSLIGYDQWVVWGRAGKGVVKRGHSI